MKPFRIPGTASISYLTGVIPAARSFVLAQLVQQPPISLTVILCPGIAEARRLMAVIPQFLDLPGNIPSPRLCLLPPPPPEEDPDDPLPERLREEMDCDRLTTLTWLANNVLTPDDAEPILVFTTPEGLFAPAPGLKELSRCELRLKTGQEIGFDSLKSALGSDLDYYAEAICERPGQFAVRGGLVDIYPLNANAPVRLDFFGDELESIRSYDPTTQRSIAKLSEVTIAARNVGAVGAGAQSIFSYLGESAKWILLEPADLQANYPAQFQVFERLKDQRAALSTLFADRQDRPDRWIVLQELETDPLCIPESIQPISLRLESLETYRRNPLETTLGMERLEEETMARRDFLDQLSGWLDSGETHVAGLISTEGKISELKALLAKEGYPGISIDFRVGDLPEGFILRGGPVAWSGWPLAGKCHDLVLVTERELLGRHVERRPVLRQRLLPHRTRIDNLLDFADLADGDYLVHLSHGICRYRGLARMEIRGREEDVISIEFADVVTLHVPLADAHLLTRYVGLSRTHPKLGKLGSNLWDKTRAAAEKATVDYAAEMLQLQAARSHGGGHAFGQDTEWQKAFENAFPYKETIDQAKAIEDTRLDMQSAKPMDRLVCGDVGFGKTEVAIRAAFKAVMEGFQVAVMVPTTVLAQQHYETIRERFAPYPVSVEMLSRFRNSAQQKEIVAQLRSGKLDLVIGTHRLLSKDVRFANLGLLVIDEEHRFGVRHKERLKQYKTEVDVLSMSATPIPRTLYLALMGARDLSVIDTPPVDRLPIETLVRTYDRELVKRAISRELERGGQVFYLHNRVQSIHSVAAQLGDMLPQAKIEVGHGQMPEQTLERVMTRFVAGKTDILVCTTIIENGLDIPNCNTIIIEGADRFGLSQLYQLRGRVGRFKRQAYAYLLLHRHAQMLDQARNRLSAMRQHNQLGAGFKIAMRDLELRGAGNLLGHQQSGHIAGVGFDLYCQLLRQSIQRLKGDPAAARIRASVYLDFIREGKSGTASAKRVETGFAALVDEELAGTRIEPVSASLPEEYIPETRLRIDFYRQLAMASSLEEIAEIEASLKDRFGSPLKPVKRLISASRIRVRAEMAGIRSVETDGNRLKCRPANSKRGEYIQLSGRFPRLTGQSADLRLREIEQFLDRQSPTV